MPRDWSKISRIAKDVEQEGQQQSASEAESDRFSIPLRGPEPGAHRSNRRPRGIRKANNFGTTTSRSWNHSIDNRTSTPDGTTGREVRSDSGRRSDGIGPSEHPGSQRHDEDSGKHSSLPPTTDRGAGVTRHHSNTVFNRLAFQSPSQAQNSVTRTRGEQFLRDSSSAGRPTDFVDRQLPPGEQREVFSPSEFEHVLPSSSHAPTVRNPLPDVHHLADEDVCEYVYTFVTLSTILAPANSGSVHGTTLRSQTVISVCRDKTSESTHSDLTNFRRPMSMPPPSHRPRYELRHSLVLHVYGKSPDAFPRLRTRYTLYDQTSSHTI